MNPDFERSGQYTVTRPSRHDLPQALSMSIHEEAVAAYKEGKEDTDNPYSPGCAAYLQWDHSYHEWEETVESYYEP